MPTKAEELRLPFGKLLRIKDDIGNTLGSMKLVNGSILFYPKYPITVSGDPLTICIPTHGDKADNNR